MAPVGAEAQECLRAPCAPDCTSDCAPDCIVSVSKESGSQGVAGTWFDLNGRRLNGKPTARGIYIDNNGRKVVFK